MKTENRDRDIEYRTHPLVKAGLIMAAMVTAAVCAASYGFYRYVSAGGEADKSSRERCAYEAYVSLCEDLVRGETVAAADALSRCELFTDCGEAPSLREAILSESVDEEIADALAIDGKVTPESIAEAVRNADRASKNALREYPSVLGQSVYEGDDGGETFWATLEGRAEVSVEKARKVASDCIGGVTLQCAESHTFPLVYTFVCKNASADVTRMGGKLLRFYSFRRGDAETRSVAECREAARDFLRGAGIANGVLLSEREEDDVRGGGNGGGVEFVFCGSFDVDGETVSAVDETVTIRVARGGARVYFFDAFEYYKRKPVGYGTLKVDIGRAEAARELGVGERFLSLIYSDGRLFWRLSGVKTLLFDVKTGEIRPQNP